MLVRIVIAVLIALVVVGVLDYLAVLNHNLNVLIGILAGLVYYFGSNRAA
jgi:hypothetical protein